MRRRARRATADILISLVVGRCHIEVYGRQLSHETHASGTYGYILKVLMLSRDNTGHSKTRIDPPTPHPTNEFALYTRPEVLHNKKVRVDHKRCIGTATPLGAGELDQSHATRTPTTLPALKRGSSPKRVGRFSVFLDLREHARKDFQAQVLLIA